MINYWGFETEIEDALDCVSLVVTITVIIVNERVSEWVLLRF